MGVFNKFDEIYKSMGGGGGGGYVNIPQCMYTWSMD